MLNDKTYLIQVKGKGVKLNRGVKMMIDRIKEARLLFMNKGIMKRDFLRNEIAFSWARSQVYSVDPEALNIEKNIQVKSLIIDENKLKNFPMIEAILIINYDGTVSKSNQISDNAMYKDINFLEISLGTNGFALALSTQKKSYVSSYEHYHKLFFERLTYGIPFKFLEENKVLGLIINQNTENFHQIQEALNEFSDELIQDFLKTNQEKLPLDSDSTADEIDDLYAGNSDKILSFKSTVNGLKNLNNNIFLQGKKGSGKEVIARLIHQQSLRRYQKFYSLYCDKLPSNVIVDEIFDEMSRSIDTNNNGSFGTVYCEAFETLSLKSQEVLMRLLESKVVNSKPMNACELNGYRFIFSSNKSLDEIRNEGEVNEKLLNRINVFTIEIPTLQEIQEDIPFLVTKKIEKYSKQYFLDEVVFDEDLLKCLSNYSWPENYRELDKVIEQIMYKGRSETVIDSSYLPMRFKPSNRDAIQIETLEKTEYREIVKALGIMNHNIASTAKVLGIGRSTLYRKLDKYNIEY